MFLSGIKNSSALFSALSCLGKQDTVYCPKTFKLSVRQMHPTLFKKSMAALSVQKKLSLDAAFKFLMRYFHVGTFGDHVLTIQQR